MKSSSGARRPARTVRLIGVFVCALLVWGGSRPAGAELAGSGVRFVGSGVALLNPLPVEFNSTPAGGESATLAPTTTAPRRRWDAWDVGEARWFADLGSHFLRLDATGYYPSLAYGGHHLYYARYTGVAWQVEIVDGAENVGAGASLALDRAGNPHISYCDRANETLKYAHWTEMAWEIRWIISGEPCGPTSLALDQTDAPHISYAAGRTVKYIHWTGSRWDVQTIGAGAQPELALDRVDRPHIAYLGRPTGSQLDTRADAIRYAWQADAGWQEEVVVSSDNPRFCLLGCTLFTALALTLDRHDTPHLAYIYRSYGQIGGGSAGLGYARRRAEGWVVEDRVDGTGTAVALALDGAGNPHIGYTDAAAAVRYRRWTGAAWEDQGIQPVAGPGRLAIALSSQDVSHVAYQNGEERGGSALRHAKLRDGVWLAETADRTRDTGLNGALAVDGAGRPRLAYRDRGNALYYAVWTGNNWLIETVDGAQGPTLGQAALALDDANRAHVAYVASDGRLNYARQIGAGWQITTVPTQAFRGLQATAASGDPAARLPPSPPIKLTLALDRAGNPAIGYLDGDRVLRFARWDGIGWQTWDVETLPQKKYTVPDLSLALDADGAPHLAYSVNGVLRYARWDGRTWLIQEIDANAGPGVSLALDRAGAPHVAYVAADPTHALKYAAWTAGGWQTQVVGPDGAAARAEFPALAFDAAGTPHVVYNSVRAGDDAATLEIRHAQWTAGAWEIETVTAFAAPALAYGQDPSPAFALDPAGRPFIGYYDPVLHAARYAVGYLPSPAADCGPAPTPEPTDPAPPSASGTIQRQIASCVDDAYATLGATTGLYNGDAYVRTGGRPGALTPYVQYVAGLLFRDVRVPQGSRITSARVRFDFWYQSGAPVAVEIAGQLSPQAGDFRAANPWPHQRPKTVLRAAWTIIGTLNGPAESPDLAAVVQEVVGQAGWQPGNNLALLIGAAPLGQQFVDWQAFDFNPAHAAQLTISYETPAAPSIPIPAVTAMATTASRPSWQLHLPLLLIR